jgi:antitoxin component of MazEF toxin-antitoxin module
MNTYSKPVRLRQNGGSVALTIPGELVRELGLAVGDLALFKREPDGLRLRIIGHPALVELANAQDTDAAQTATEAAE